MLTRIPHGKCALGAFSTGGFLLLHLSDYDFPDGFCCCCYLVTQSCPTLLLPHGLQSIRHLCSWDFPGKNTGVGCHVLLQGFFPTLGLNQHLQHQQDLLPLYPLRGPLVGQFYVFLGDISGVLIHRLLFFFQWIASSLFPIANPFLI